MTTGTTQEYETLTVSRVTPVAGTAGVAILLDTKERGQVAFAVNADAIAAFRTALAMIEEYVRQNQIRTPN